MPFTERILECFLGKYRQGKLTVNRNPRSGRGVSSSSALQVWVDWSTGFRMDTLKRYEEVLQSPDQGPIEQEQKSKRKSPLLFFKK